MSAPIGFSGLGALGRTVAARLAGDVLNAKRDKILREGIRPPQP